jgi:hypothetical protein
MACILFTSPGSIKQKVMKTTANKTGGLFLAIAFCMISLRSNSQDAKLSRQEQKEARQAEKQLNFQAIDTLLQNKGFIIEANTLQNASGDIINVTPSLNFIKVDSDNAVLQTGSNISIGDNGVGGITTQGRISQYKIGKNIKKLTHYVQFTVSSDIGFFDVYMIIGADSFTRATITGLGPGRLTYQGQMVAIYNSGVYKGRDAL